MKKTHPIVVDRVDSNWIQPRHLASRIPRTEDVEGFEGFLPDAIERPPYDESILWAFPKQL